MRVNSPYCVFVVSVTQVTTFVGFGLSLASLNPVTPILTNFINKSHQIRYGAGVLHGQATAIMTLAQSALIVGAMIGAMLAKIFLSRFSRRRNLLIIHNLVVLSSLIIGPAARLLHSYEALIVGRFIGGVAYGISYSVTPLFVAETVSRSTVSMYQSPAGWLMRIGQILGNGLGHEKVLGTAHNWPYLLVLPGLCSLFFLACYAWIPNTPGFIIRRGKKSDPTGYETETKTYELLRKLRSGEDKRVTMELEETVQEIESEEGIRKAGLLEILRNGVYRRQLIAAVLVVCSVQLTGIQAVVLYTDAIFIAGGVPARYATYMSMATFGLSFAASVFGTPLLKKFGGRKMLLTGLTISTMSMVTLAVSTVTKDRFTIMPYVSLASVISFVLGVSVGPFLTFMSLMSELTTQTTRPNALWVAGVVYWMLGSAVSLSSPLLLEVCGGFAYIPFVVLASCEMLYIFFFVPDTHRRHLADIQHQFQCRKLSSVKSHSRSDESEVFVRHSV